jgi:hypothetical protein
MQLKYIPALVTLLAGAITSIINIIHKVELITGLKRLLLVLIIFYFIGLAAKGIIERTILQKPEEKDDEDPLSANPDENENDKEELADKKESQKVKK